MQPIERYGVVALLFLVALVLVVALWDDGGATPAAESDAATVAIAPRSEPAAAPAAIESASRADAQREVGRRADERQSPAVDDTRRLTAPLGSRHGDEGSARRMRTRFTEDHGTEPLPELISPATRELEQLEQEPLATVAVRRVETEPVGADLLPQPVAARRSERAADLARQVSRTEPVVAPPAPSFSGSTYEVQPGDALERIARRTLGDGSRWRDIASLNGLEPPYMIQVGMKLKLPEESGAPGTQNPRTREATPDGRGDSTRDDEAGPVRRDTVSPRARVAAEGTRSYTVAKGDMLSVIAQRELGSAKRMKEIIELNPGMNPDRILVGNAILLPDDGIAPRAAGSQVVAQVDEPRSRRSGDARPVDARYRVR